MLRKVLLILIACGALAGCATGPDPQPEHPKYMEDFTGDDDTDWWW